MLQQKVLQVIEQLQDLHLKSDSLQDQLSHSDHERLLFQSKMDLAIKDLLQTCQLYYTSFMDQRFMMWTQEQQHVFLTWQQQLFSELQSGKLQITPSPETNLSLVTTPEVQHIIQRLDILESLREQRSTQALQIPDII
jgi:hypothetical protein